FSVHLLDGLNQILGQTGLESFEKHLMSQNLVFHGSLTLLDVNAAAIDAAIRHRDSNAQDRNGHGHLHVALQKFDHGLHSSSSSSSPTGNSNPPTPNRKSF